MNYAKITTYTIINIMFVCGVYFMLGEAGNTQDNALLDLSNLKKGEYILMQSSETCKNWINQLNLDEKSIDKYVVVGPFASNHDTLSAVAKLGPCGSPLQIINHS